LLATLVHSHELTFREDGEMARESLGFPRVHSCKDPALQVHDGRDVVSRHQPYECSGIDTGHKLTSLVRAAKLRQQASIEDVDYRSPRGLDRALFQIRAGWGAKIGGLAVLHTWGQALAHHPHVHCVVPGAGLSSDGTRWVAARPSFFLAIKPLSRLFRHLFLERLQAAFDARMLGFYANLTHLADRDAFAAHVQAMRRNEWSTPRSRSSDPPRFSPISAATPMPRSHRAALCSSMKN